MFKAIRHFFSSPEAEDAGHEYSLRADGLRDYVMNKVSGANKELSSQVDEIRHAVHEGVEHLEESLNVLEKAELLNPNIPLQTVQFMEGNRDAFLKKARYLKDKCEVPEDLQQMLSYVRWVKSKIHEFYGGAGRSAQVISQFFSNEVAEVNLVINALEGAYNDLEKRMIAADFKRYDAILSRVTSIENIIKKQKTQALEILEKREGITMADRRLHAIMLEMDRIVQSPEFFEIKELKKTVVNYNTRTRLLEEELKMKFSAIQKALSKFGHISIDHEPLIQDYLVDPVKTLMKDDKLVILSIIELLRDHVEIGSITLDDKRKDKTLRQIKTLNENYLKTAQGRLKEIYHSSADIAHKVNTSALNRRYVALVNEKDELEKQQAGLKDRLGTLGEEVSGTLAIHIKEFVRLAEEAFGDHVTVV